tara:strand:+ start:492 stop:1097 length:606 start_codon:yes stop_codon:yes gene_type:complete
MKKFFTILTVVAFTTTISFAQAQFGIKAGLNIAAIGSSEDGAPEDARMGMQLGGIAMFGLSDAVQLRTGLTYTQKGASNAKEDGMETDVIFAMDYLEVPIDFAFMLGDGGFSLSAGPYIAFLMGANTKYDGETVNFNEDNDMINGMDFGLNLGMSFLINEQILIDAKYGMGLSDITNDEYMGDEVSVNGVLQISVGYVFGN